MEVRTLVPVVVAALGLAGCAGGDDPRLTEAASACDFGPAVATVTGQTLELVVPVDEADGVTTVGECLDERGIDVSSSGAAQNASQEDLFTAEGLVLTGADGKMVVTIWNGQEQVVDINDHEAFEGDLDHHVVIELHDARDDASASEGTDEALTPEALFATACGEGEASRYGSNLPGEPEYERYDCLEAGAGAGYMYLFPDTASQDVWLEGRSCASYVTVAGPGWVAQRISSEATLADLLALPDARQVCFG
ncbi:MAG: hypothetical protein ACK5MR_16585 [Cumulibacter sp.]